MLTFRTNWAGNITFEASRTHRPSSIDQLRDIVAGSRRFRVLGTGHSFNRIADTRGDLISVADLPRVMDIDGAASTVTVAAGVRYGELAQHLHAAGYALANLGSLPHISIAGACATGTHGSGDGNRSLAAAVAAVAMVNPDGDIVELRRGDDDFAGAVVALGSLGVVTSLTLDVQPTFDVRQYVYDGLPFDSAVASFDEIAGSAYSVSMFTDWTGSGFGQVWLKHRSDDGAGVAPRRWLGAALADAPRHPVPGMPVANCTQQLGEPGPWHTRLPHFRLEFAPSSGAELQSEYLVPRRHAAAALRALDGIREQIAPALQVSEIRTVAADELWLSPSYGRDSVALHFTWVPDLMAVTLAMSAIEPRLAEFDVRPHWGKLFLVEPSVLSGRYERWADFADLMGRHDPAGVLRNDMLDWLFPA